ncbi:MAG: UDP-glucose 4-epimerase [Myxococcota bacterium]
MKNVMIDGASSPLAAKLAEALSHRTEVQRLVGVEPEVSAHWSPDVELIDCEVDHRLQLQYLQDYEIDTVIQCGFSHGRTGAAGEGPGADVIETMRLSAAIGHAGSPVRSWVVLSSSDVYPVDSKRPLLDDERSPTDSVEGSLGASIIEAEEYVVDVARRSPHVNVAILRLQELVGKGVRGPLAAHFDQSIVPHVLGHDPLLQFLHLEDAIQAIAFAADLELAGIYNVASREAIRFEELIRFLGKSSVPLLPIESGALASIASRLGLPNLRDELLAKLRFGHVIDTCKIEAAGFKASADQFDCATAMG